MKMKYSKPQTEMIYIDPEELLRQPGASRVVNETGGQDNGIIIGNPDEIGAKQGLFESGWSNHHSNNMWDD